MIRRFAIPLGAATAAAAALLAAARWAPAAPDGALPRPWLGLALAALAAAGALHRPLGGRTLGIGAAALAPLAVAVSAVAAGWAAAAALVGADLARGWAVRRWQATEGGEGAAAGSASASLGAGARAALGALAGGLAWRWAAAPAGGWAPAGDPVLPGDLAGPGVAAAAAAGAYLGVSLLVDLALGRAAAGRWRAPGWGELRPYALDLAGWVVGGAAVAAGGGRGWAPAAVLLAAVALLAAEAARHALLLAGARQRLAALDRVRQAGQRMIAPSSEIASVVERIRAECANVIDNAWFQLELVAAGAGGASWQAGPGGLLAPGAPAPEPSPPPLPGVHRRTAWRVVERALGSEAGQVARLRLWCDPRRLKDEDLELLEALLPQMAASLQQALLDREAREDALTGAAVRRVLERRLFEAYAAACEQGGAVAVILCDLDRFKQINDAHGHAAGDRALGAAGAALAGAKRTRDLLARYGGEEFALLLEATDGATALAVAERLRRRVGETTFDAGGSRVPLSLSAGVAAFPELHVKTASELLLLADEALYEAKGRGRDRCLLNAGRGRYVAPDGAVVETAAKPPAPRPPRLFA
jgi:diguanylate cyclase (GGDEF)-like protein